MAHPAGRITGGVRLLRGLGFDEKADAPALRTVLERGRLALAAERRPSLADELVDSRHTMRTSEIWMDRRL